MAGNRPGDNSGNILVDFDYNNIIVVDPNKTIDAFGNIAERLVDHENLVMYANLEAEVVPRTKLSVGGSPEDRIRTISVAKMNFLRPTEGTYLSTGYYELTVNATTNYFPSAKTFLTLSLTADETAASGCICKTNDDSIFVKTYAITGKVQTNDLLVNAYLEIRIYN